MSPVRTNLTIGLVGAAAAIALGAGSTVAVAAASGAFDSGNGSTAYGPHGSTAHGPQVGPYAGRGAGACDVPSLPGAVVDVTLTDMGGGMMGGGSGGMMGNATDTHGWSGRGGMSVEVSPVSVSAGEVSLDVANEGMLTHELVVLPLTDDTQVGDRTVGSDGEVSEDGSLGEASNTCAEGEGDGIAAGSQGWVTLDLAPGRYELICNLPGHYEAGMYAELDVRA